MPSLNLCQFIGNVGREPEVRTTTSGQHVASWSMAVNESWKDSSGQKQEKTEWIKCTAWGRLAEIVAKYVTKGSPLYVSGRMSTRKWQAQDGSDRYTTEIVVSDMQMLSKSGDRSQQDAQHGAQSQHGHMGQPYGQQTGSGPAQAEIRQPFDDDVPF